MNDTRKGLKSQHIGEVAETKVRDALLDAGFSCSKYENDRGEDLLIEIDGYIPKEKLGYEPNSGVLQIKGHKFKSDSKLDKKEARTNLKVKHLKRWAAIPLPVFVVVVRLDGKKVHFYAKSVDKLVVKYAPDGLDALDQKSVTVRFPLIPDIAEYLKREIIDFYSMNAFKLSGLSETIIARNHYEIISSNDSYVSPTAKIWMKHIRVLWKGPWRPAHFWATLNHIADMLLKKYGGRRAIPLDATLHVYRSLKDTRDNNAVAHVSWLEENHPCTETVKQLLGWPKTIWARFRFYGKTALESPPEPFFDEIDDDEFLAKAAVIYSKYDTFYEKIRSSITTDLRIKEKLHKQLQESILEYELNVIEKLGRPSPQFRFIDEMMGQYYSVLDGILCWLKGKDDVAEITRKRWLKQDLELAEGHYKSFQLLVKQLRGN